MAKYDPYDLLPEGVAEEWRKEDGLTVEARKYSLQTDWGSIRITIYVPSKHNNITYFDFFEGVYQTGIMADFRQPYEVDMVVQLLNKLSASRETSYDLMHYLRLQKLWGA